MTKLADRMRQLLKWNNGQISTLQQNWTIERGNRYQHYNKIGQLEKDRYHNPLHMATALLSPSSEFEDCAAEEAKPSTPDKQDISVT